MVNPRPTQPPAQANAQLVSKTQTENTADLKEKFNTFVQSLGDVLLDITALEVNTMVVSEITGSKFNPESAYRNLYEIANSLDNPAYFLHRGIPEKLWERYIKLRTNLEADYRQAIEEFGPHHGLPLPDPDHEAHRLQELFKNAQFLRALRKLNELKAGVDSDSTTQPKVDIIFAQTVIQLDGDIINRYHQHLFKHPYRDVIIEMHNQGVTSGEKQWQGLLQFMVTLMQGIFNSGSRGGSSFSIFPQNGQKQNSNN